MTWNHRVIRKMVMEGQQEIPIFQIYEVYYNEDGEIDGWTMEPDCPMGETLEELKNDIQYNLKALDAPVLEEVVIDGKEVLKEVR